MSNIILNADISENSSFASDSTRLSLLSKNKIVIPSKISEPDNNNIQPVKPSVVSNFTRLSLLSKQHTDQKSTVSESNSKLSIQRSVATSVADTQLSFQQIPISSKSITSINNDDDEIVSNKHSKNSDKQSINTHSIVTNSINKTQPNIMNRVVIDVAVLCQEYTTIETMCHDNIINLDEIHLTKEVFQSIFYPYHENFGLNKDFVNNNMDISSHISFIPEFRSVNSKKFYLLEEIISNIERDLNISRNCFTKESLVELTNEIISIKSLCDINCCSVLASLSWQNILEIIKNYQLINYCQCEKGSESGENYCKICKNSKSEIIPICVVNIIFKTPTPGVKNTIIRFNYRITNL